MLITDRPAADVEALRARLHGEVYGPETPATTSTASRGTAPSISAPRPSPSRAPTPTSSRSSTSPATHGLELAPQATGHGAGATGSLEHTILVSTKHMRGVRIDPNARTARVRAGAVWSDVTVPAARTASPRWPGSAPDVGVVGYTLGGGLSWLARAHGLACNSVTAIELVTADGRLVRTDARTEPELFWALRGGGTTAYGIVTAIEFELYPVAELHGGALLFPGARATEVFTAWRDWTRTVPDEVTSLCRLVSPPGGDPIVLVEAAILGDDSVARPAARAGPVADLVSPMTPDRLTEIHNDPKEPSAGAHGHRLLNDVPDGALAGLVDHAGAPLVSVELRHLGGALSRGSVCHGALNDVKAEFALFAVGLVPDAQAAMAVDAALARLTDALEPWDAGRALLNFTERPARFHDGFTQHRLRALKAQLDGAGIVRRGSTTGSSSTA